MSNQALSDLKVVEFGRFISASHCAKLLADLGAEVIKVEPPGSGDEARLHGPFPQDIPHPERSGLFLDLNTSKLGVTLNPDTVAGRQVLLRLIERADALVENNSPGRMTDLGLDYASLRRLNPSLVVTSITPFGQAGPYRNWKGYDINCAALGGTAWGTGRPDREPLALPLFQCHYQAAVAAAVATISALLARELAGQGQHIDVSEAEVLATVHRGSQVATYVQKGTMEPSARRYGNRRAAPYPICLLPCKDGYVCVLGPQLQQWIRFVELMGSPEWSRNPRYRNRRAMGEEYPEEVDALLAPWLMAHTKDEIFALAIEHGIPIAPVKTVEEQVNDAHLRERGFMVEIERPEVGVLTYPGAPFKLSETPWKPSRPAPLLGEHNEAVYCGLLGYSRQDLVQLRNEGVI
ncbi:MAG: CoA transferase [Chloroflexi bacterium]|nr:CoA transferase [Chloroflexota bacterium]